MCWFSPIRPIMPFRIRSLMAEMSVSKFPLCNSDLLGWKMRRLRKQTPIANIRFRIDMALKTKRNYHRTIRITQLHQYALAECLSCGRCPLDLISSELDVLCKFIFMYSSNSVQEAHDLSSPGQSQQPHCDMASSTSDQSTVVGMVGQNVTSKIKPRNGRLTTRDVCFMPNTAAVFNKMLKKFKKKRKRNPQENVSEVERRLRANDRDYNEQFDYARNFIRTSKYNLFTFLPKNLFEQFQRLANFYFLILMILQLIPQISSLTSLTTILPLVAVLSLTAAKDAFDDLQRHRSDNQVNNRKSQVVRGGQVVEEKWQNVRVGDVIRMENDNFVAADLLLLSTSEPHGLCYIETAELDGETNLKAKQALPETAAMGDDLIQISNFDGDIQCEAPNNCLSSFQGRLSWKEKTYPLDNEKMLLRGCVLRNTKWCFGVVIFAGRDTKLMMNSGKTFFKRTSLDRFLNVLIIGIVLFLLSMCMISAVLCGTWEWTTGKNFQAFLPWDSFVEQHSTTTATVVFIAFLVFFSYAILLNTVVPISLYVSVEIIRVCHSWWINWDENLYYAPMDTAARSRTTTLNEELGQVQYIFSDKTGTLTQNIMIFNKCSINGIVYGDMPEEEVEQDKVRGKGGPRPISFSDNKWADDKFVFYDHKLFKHTKQRLPAVDQYWRCLCLCHTVMSEMKTNRLEYQAQSPDEAALTVAARCFGYVFLSRTPRSITVEVMGVEEEYELLCILDFNNVRKRMSVIVKKSDKIELYCKGADTVILRRITAKPTDKLYSTTQAHLDKFASDGLRTLCLAYKEISVDYYEEWRKRCHEASISLENRQDKLDAIYDEIETGMTLLGATAIEDKLQDGVPQTIANLIAANIKVWVLTGDKQETAINIGYSCRLLTVNLKEVFIVDGYKMDEVRAQLERIEQQIILNNTNTNTNTNSNGDVVIAPLANDSNLIDSVDHLDGYALVINGHSLVHALQSNMELQFLKVATACKAVICCRVTPLQKALVVSLVKRNQKAGMQAVLASDFCIAQFRYLERLLLVHGRWSYYRMCKFLQYFFYKNFAFTLAHFWFAFFCGYSAQTIYDPLFIACYNLFFTALPVIGVGVFDQDVSDKNSLRYPELYIPGQQNLYFNMRIFTYSVLRGFFSSGVLFFIPYAALSENVDFDGKSSAQSMQALSFTIFTALIVTVTAQIALDTAYWTVMNHIFVWGSLAFYFFVALVYYELMPFDALHHNGYGTALEMFLYPNFWFSIILIVVLLMLPHISVRFFWVDVFPSLSDRIRVKQNLRRLQGRLSEVPLQSLTTASSLRRRRASTRSSYAFSHHPGFGELITKGLNMRQWKNELKLSTVIETLRRSSTSINRDASTTSCNDQQLQPTNTNTA
ncbi:putative phospholipid-transporting ATPase ID [Trichinella zimbabwensis]|uniref:Phospholipid-transporting ATPase n=1 Tax=Trichinella zimbabwensis TaxID=268475 RepID=A0A0V1I0S8_9BILA|nr:putative phospholipid-transporting ATPase ID [Trichinella zimbabwensis]